MNLIEILIKNMNFDHMQNNGLTQQPQQYAEVMHINVNELHLSSYDSTSFWVENVVKLQALRVTATGLEPTSIQFVNEHSAVQLDWPTYQFTMP